MSKTGLGRGLGSLMGEKKTEAAQSDANAPQQPLAGPGVGSLLRGVKKEEKNVFAEPPPAPVEPPQPRPQHQPQPQTQQPQPFSSPYPKSEMAQKPLIPRWYFFAADVLLIALALGIFFGSSGALDFKRAAICVIAIVLAAVLGVIGVWMGRKED